MLTWKKTWGIFGLLLLSQLVLRTFLFFFQYKGLNYFGGDSGVYYMTAENLEMKNHFWPIGWPLLLKAFLLLGHSPYVLLLIQTSFGLLAQFFFIRTLTEHGRIRLGIAALLSLPFFCNPAWIRLNSLFLMADTLVVFFVLVSVYYGLRFLKSTGSTKPSSLFLFSLLLGCGTFFKLVLRVVSLPIALGLLWRSISQGPPFRRWISALTLICGFMIGPALYVGFVQWPRYQTLDFDIFSGYSLFANIVPFSNCKALIESYPNPQEKDAVEGICNEELVQAETPAQLWRTESFLGQAQRHLFRGKGRVETNRWLSAWARRLILQDPSVAFMAAKRNLEFYLRVSHQDSLSFSEPASWPMAEKAIRDFFGRSVEDYRLEAEAFREENQASLQFIDRITGPLSLPLRWLGLAWLFAVFPLAIFMKSLRRSLPIAGLTTIYGAAIVIAGYYEPRAFIVLDVLLYLTLCLGAAEVYMVSRRN